MLGGANCDGAQGESAHRNFPFIDFVVRGEGEAAFPRLLEALRQDPDPEPGLASVSGLCRRSAGRSVANPMSTSPLPPSAIIAPDYAGYFERLAASTART